MEREENLQAVRQIVEKLEEAEYVLGGKEYSLNNKIEALRDKKLEANDRVLALNETVHTVEGGNFIFTGTLAEIDKQLSDREKSCLQTTLTIDEEINRIRERNSDYTNGNIGQMVRGKVFDELTQLEGDKEVQRKRQSALSLARHSYYDIIKDNKGIQAEIDNYISEIDFNIGELNNLKALREEVNTSLDELKAALDNENSNISMDSDLCKEALNTLSIVEPLIGNVAKDTKDFEEQFDEQVEKVASIEKTGEVGVDIVNNLETSLSREDMQRLQNIIDINTLKHPIISALSDLKTAKVRIEDARDRLSMQGIEYQTAIHKTINIVSNIARDTYNAVFAPIGRGTISLAKGMASGLRDGWENVKDLTKKALSSISKVVDEAQHKVNFAVYGAIDLMTFGASYQIFAKIHDAHEKINEFAQKNPNVPLYTDLPQMKNIDMSILKEAHEATWGGLNNSPVDKGIELTEQAVRDIFTSAEAKFKEVKSATSTLSANVKETTNNYLIDLCHNISNIAEKQALSTMEAMSFLVDQTNSAYGLNLKAENFANRINGEIVLAENNPQKADVKNMFSQSTNLANQLKVSNGLLPFCYKDVQKAIKIGEAMVIKDYKRTEMLAKKAAVWDKIATIFMKKENDISRMKSNTNDIEQDSVGFER